MERKQKKEENELSRWSDGSFLRLNEANTPLLCCIFIACSFKIVIFAANNQKYTMIKTISKYMLLAVIAFLCVNVWAQTLKWRDMYQVKKKDTLFGIAKSYGITLEELITANPDMKVAGYELKKGDYIFIPYPSTQKPAASATQRALSPAADVRNRAIRVGVMLPLHNVDGDGKRMVEYYRGLLMGCDSLRQQGISTEVYAWNVSADADVRQTLLKAEVKKCDIIFGPLYTKQVRPLADFCKTAGIKLVIPFSIGGDEVVRNPQVYQVYQSTDELNNATIDAFLERFAKQHPVFIDCNDSTSKKGIFTSALRNQLNARGISYSITNLRSPEDAFAKAFSRTQPNVVVLNTGRSPELSVALAKINGLTVNLPGIVISLFGYTEWLMYTKQHLDHFFKYNTYIPTTFYYNPLSTKTQQLENSYRRWFSMPMQYALPRFALTGYDHAQFFLRGLHKYGKAFMGTKEQNVYTALQTPMSFQRVGNGGMQNVAFMLIHYTYDRKIESLAY